jgi:hypothetical protein
VVVGIHEELQVNSQLLVAVVVVALDRRILDRAVHPLDLTVGPRMVYLGQPVLNIVLGTDAIEDVREGIGILLAVGELDAIFGQDDVDVVGDCCDQIPQELRCLHLAGTLDQTKANLLVRSIATNRDSLPSSVLTCAMSMWK